MERREREREMESEAQKAIWRGLACACATINFISNACNNGCHAFNGLCILCMAGHGFCLITLTQRKEKKEFFLKKKNKEKKIKLFGISFGWCVLVSEAESHPYYITNVFYSHF